MQLGDRMIGDAAQCVGKPGLWIDAVEFCRNDEGVDRGSALAASVGAGEHQQVPLFDGYSVVKRRAGDGSIAPITGRRMLVKLISAWPGPIREQAPTGFRPISGCSSQPTDRGLVDLVRAHRPAGRSETA